MTQASRLHPTTPISSTEETRRHFARYSRDGVLGGRVLTRVCPSDDGIRPAFIRDAMMRARAAHPNVVATLEIATRGDSLVCVHEAPAVVDLATLVNVAQDADKRISARLAIATLMSLAQTIADLVEVDLAPVVLTSAEVGITRGGSVVLLPACGNPDASYVAPEVVHQVLRRELQTQVWAMGRLLRVLLSTSEEKNARPKVSPDEVQQIRPLLVDFLSPRRSRRPSLADARARLEHAGEMIGISSAPETIVEELRGFESAAFEFPEEVVADVVGKPPATDSPSVCHWRFDQAGPPLEGDTALFGLMSRVHLESIFLGEGAQSSSGQENATLDGSVRGFDSRSSSASKDAFAELGSSDEGAFAFADDDDADTTAAGARIAGEAPLVAPAENERTSDPTQTLVTDGPSVASSHERKIDESGAARTSRSSALAVPIVDDSSDEGETLPGGGLLEGLETDFHGDAGDRASETIVSDVQGFADVVGGVSDVASAQIETEVSAPEGLSSLASDIARADDDNAVFSSGKASAFQPLQAPPPSDSTVVIGRETLIDEGSQDVSSSDVGALGADSPEDEPNWQQKTSLATPRALRVTQSSAERAFIGDEGQADGWQRSQRERTGQSNVVDDMRFDPHAPESETDAPLDSSASNPASDGAASQVFSTAAKREAPLTDDNDGQEAPTNTRGGSQDSEKTELREPHDHDITTSMTSEFVFSQEAAIKVRKAAEEGLRAQQEKTKAEAEAVRAALEAEAENGWEENATLDGKLPKPIPDAVVGKATPHAPLISPTLQSGGQTPRLGTDSRAAALDPATPTVTGLRSHPHGIAPEPRTESGAAPVSPRASVMRAAPVVNANRSFANDDHKDATTSVSRSRASSLRSEAGGEIHAVRRLSELQPEKGQVSRLDAPPPREGAKSSSSRSTGAESSSSLSTGAESSNSRSTGASYEMISGEEKGAMVVEARAGASVFVNGIWRGVGRVVITDLDRFLTYSVRVHCPGFAPWSGAVSLGGEVAARVAPNLVPRTPNA